MQVNLTTAAVQAMFDHHGESSYICHAVLKYILTALEQNFTVLNDENFTELHQFFNDDSNGRFANDSMTDVVTSHFQESFHIATSRYGTTVNSVFGDFEFDFKEHNWLMTITAKNGEKFTIFDIYQTQRDIRQFMFKQHLDQLGNQTMIKGEILPKDYKDFLQFKPDRNLMGDYSWR